MIPNEKNKPLIHPEVETEDLVLSKLIVHNDDINTFDWVIESLMEICKHSEEQAEQCALLIHFKGLYCVKTGEFDCLKPMKDGLSDRHISATIE